MSKLPVAHFSCAVMLCCAVSVLADETATPTETAQATTSPPEAAAPRLMLDGYCPVSILADKQWRAGDPELAVVHDGREYRFASAEHRDRFDADRGRFTPMFGGDCIVTYEQRGRREAGKLAFAAFFGGRLLLFSNGDARERFRANPGVYSAADLAYGGRSPIALVDDERTVRGDESFEAFHRGFRYWFASDVEREQFLADPEKYAVERRATEVAAGERTVSVTGRSSCAYCDHKVWPMLTKGELGLAIEGNDGTLYIVEHADSRFPQLYNDRFDNITMTVTGREIKREGKTVWLVPTTLVAGT